MRKLCLAIIAVILLATCAPKATRKPDQTLPEKLIERPWRYAMEICHVDPIAETVVCPVDGFVSMNKSTVAIWKDLKRTKLRLDSSIKLNLVDKRLLSAQVYDLTLKLNSPWRSPWLWGVIGLVVGAAVTTGLVIGLGR